MPSGGRIPRPAPRAASTPTWPACAGSSNPTGRCAGRAGSWSRPGPAYVLHLVPGQPDAVAFEQDLGRARQLRKAGDPAGAVAALNSALSLWRGIAFAGVPGPFAETERVRLGELRSAAAEERADVLLSLGRHEEVVPDLTAMVADHPLRERMRGLLMIALYRCGRQAEALRVYQEGRRVLAEELGIDPGGDLSRIHQQVLTMDPPWPPRTARPWRRLGGRAVRRGRDGARIRARRRAAAAPECPRTGSRRCRPSCRSTRRASPAATKSSACCRRCCPRSPPGPPGRARTGQARQALGPDGADRGHLGHGGNGEDRARRPVRPSGRQAVPRRPALRQPARPGSGHPADGAGRGAAVLPRRAGRAAAPDPGRHRGPVRPVPQPARRQADADRPGQRAQRGPGAAAAARLAGLPGRGDQPQRDDRAGGRRGRGAAHARRAQRRRGARDARPPARPGPGRGRTRGGGRDHRLLRPPPAGPGHRGRPRGRPAQAPADRAGRRAARRPGQAGRARGRRRGDQRAGRALLVLRPALRARGADVPPARRASRARTSRCRRRPAWPGWPAPTRAPRCAS